MTTEEPGGPGPRYVDRGLADDDALLRDDDQEEYATPPPAWTDVPQPRTPTPQTPQDGTAPDPEPPAGGPGGAGAAAATGPGGTGGATAADPGGTGSSAATDPGGTGSTAATDPGGTGGAAAAARAHHHVDRALTDDDDPLIDDDQEAYVPPPPVSTDIPAPRTETPEAPEAPRGGGAATGRAYGPAAPPYAPTSPYAPAAPPVDAARRVRPCWQCGHPLPPGTSSCPECLEPTRHLRLIGSRPRLDLRHGEGAPLRLGRHPVWARPEVFGALQCEREVSRCHAVVQLAPDGTLWLTENPRGTANGTYVNHERIPRGGRVRLEDGDVIGLGEKVAFTVLLPDPAG